jgi:hypothetical protein
VISSPGRLDPVGRVEVMAVGEYLDGEVWEDSGVREDSQSSLAVGAVTPSFAGDRQRHINLV